MIFIRGFSPNRSQKSIFSSRGAKQLAFLGRFRDCLSMRNWARKNWLLPQVIIEVYLHWVNTLFGDNLGWVDDSLTSLPVSLSLINGGGVCVRGGETKEPGIIIFTSIIVRLRTAEWFNWTLYLLVNYDSHQCLDYRGYMFQYLPHCTLRLETDERVRGD